MWCNGRRVYGVSVYCTRVRPQVCIFVRCVCVCVCVCVYVHACVSLCVCVCVLDMFLVTYIVCGLGRVRRGAQVVSV